MNQNILVSLLCLFALLGCRDKEDDDYELTPNGYRIYWVEDQGSFSGGWITKELLFYWVDQQIDQWVLSHPEYAADSLYEVARKEGYYLHDHFRFPSNASPTGYAAGQISGWRIDAGIYGTYVSLAYPSGIPPHTIVPTDNYWRHGDHTKPLVPVIPHELDHAIGIHHGKVCANCIN